jgi:ribosomal protein S1
VPSSSWSLELRVFLPVTETTAGRGADIKKTLPIGTTVDVIVLEIDPAGRRIRLSIKAIQDAAEDANVRDYTARADAETKDSSFRVLSPTSCESTGTRDDRRASRSMRRNRLGR